MFRKHISTWAVLLLILVALAAVAVAGCGSSTSASSSSAPAATNAATTMSADQIVAQSEAKMKDVKSASFTGDMSLKVSGDPSKMTDPTSKAMLSQGISLHMEGKSQNQPVASDMKISLGLGGQTIALSLLSQGTKSWVEYQGKWYAMDAKAAKSLSTQAQTGAAPTEQLKSLGLNPSDWGTSYALVGTEDLAGAKVYHVKATADPQKLADALMKAGSNNEAVSVLYDSFIKYLSDKCGVNVGALTMKKAAELIKERFPGTSDPALAEVRELWAALELRHFSPEAALAEGTADLSHKYSLLLELLEKELKP